MKSRDLDSDEIKYLIATKDRSTLNSQKISNTEQRILTKLNKPGAKVTPKYPKQATPEQYGKLAERLERQRQMTGAPSKPLKPFKKESKKIRKLNNQEEEENFQEGKKMKLQFFENFVHVKNLKYPLTNFEHKQKKIEKSILFLHYFWPHNNNRHNTN